MPLVVNGWSIFAHPLFLDQIGRLITAVEAAKRKDPVGWHRKNAAKRLAAITRIAFELIPNDPTKSEYRQGDTLGGDRRHWFRAKFFQQYRLFFRYGAVQKIIILAWVNDDETLRAYDSASDAYATFRRMLGRGAPPDNWDELLSESRAATSRLDASLTKID